MGQAQFELVYVLEYFIKLLPSLKVTLLIVFSSTLIGVVTGLLIALPRLYHIPVLSRLSQVYVSFFRGTPILIQLFLFYYGAPEVLKMAGVDVSRVSAIYFVILTYALHSGAYISEMIRGAVSAVNLGQIEAAYAMGMNGYQAFSRIVLPQAMAISIPVFANLVIGNLKDTSLAFSLGIMEMTGTARTLGALSQRFAEIYISLALLYLFVSLVLQKLFIYVEKRLHRHEADIPAAQGRQRDHRGIFQKYKPIPDIPGKEARL